MRILTRLRGGQGSGLEIRVLSWILLLIWANDRVIVLLLLSIDRRRIVRIQTTNHPPSISGSLTSPEDDDDDSSACVSVSEQYVPDGLDLKRTKDGQHGCGREKTGSNLSISRTRDLGSPCRVTRYQQHITSIFRWRCTVVEVVTVQ